MKIKEQEDKKIRKEEKMETKEKINDVLSDVEELNYEELGKEFNFYRLVPGEKIAGKFKGIQNMTSSFGSDFSVLLLENEKKESLGIIMNKMLQRIFQQNKIDLDTHIMIHYVADRKSKKGFLYKYYKVFRIKEKNNQ